jgi:hypothetical protein
MFEKMKLPVVKIVFLCLLAVYALLTAYVHHCLE